MKRGLQSLWLGIFHGLNDMTAAYWLGRYAADSVPDAMQLFVLYNLLAFGGQFVLAGLMPGKAIRGRSFQVIGGLLACAWLSGSTLPHLTIIGLGLLSAVFHLFGGVYVLRLYAGSASHAGLFSAPGVLGIAIAGVCVVHGVSATAIGLLAAGIILGLLVLLRLPDLPAIWLKAQPEVNGHFDRHDWAMLLLLLAVVLRSGIWNIVFSSSQHFAIEPLWLAVAACCGKGLGGLMTLWLPQKRLINVLLVILILSFAVGYVFNQWLSLLIGVFCLQALNPLTWVMLEQVHLKNPLYSTSLSLGLLLLLGGFSTFPPFTGWFMSTAGMLTAITALLGAYFLAFWLQISPPATHKTREDS